MDAAAHSLMQSCDNSESGKGSKAASEVDGGEEVPVKCASCGKEFTAAEFTYKCTHDDCETYNLFHLACVHLDKFSHWVCEEHYGKPDVEVEVDAETQREE